MQRRYSVLRVIATIFKVLGVILGALTALGAIGVCASGFLIGAAANNLGRQTGLEALGGPLSGVITGFIVLLIGALYTLSIYAIGDGISLLIALEENTRATMTLLQQQARAGNVTPSVSPTTTPK